MYNALLLKLALYCSISQHMSSKRAKITSHLPNFSYSTMSPIFSKLHWIMLLSHNFLAYKESKKILEQLLKSIFFSKGLVFTKQRTWKFLHPVCCPQLSDSPWTSALRTPGQFQLLWFVLKCTESPIH